jgi:hypothetical protein
MQNWIPAFAGMTVEGLIPGSRRQLALYRGPLDHRHKAGDEDER